MLTRVDILCFAICVGIFGLTIAVAGISFGLPRQHKDVMKLLNEIKDELKKKNL